VRCFQLRRTLPWSKPGEAKLEPRPGCVVVVAADTLAIDVVTLDYVLRGDLFPVELDGRVVLDIGAHKGYFGALAVLDGAAAVVSFEPESGNFRALTRAAVTGARTTVWERRQEAVGATAGRVDLHVSSESWSHSVYAPASGDLVRTEHVPMVAFGDVLADASARWPGLPVVVKLNVEGAAGDCLLSVTAEALAPTEVLLVDLEANTPQRLDDVLAHILGAGFALLGERERVYHFARRGGGR
jgi:FkbM family methyltransferase